MYFRNQRTFISSALAGFYCTNNRLTVLYYYEYLSSVKIFCPICTMNICLQLKLFVFSQKFKQNHTRNSITFANICQFLRFKHDILLLYTCIRCTKLSNCPNNPTLFLSLFSTEF